MPTPPEIAAADNYADLCSGISQLLYLFCYLPYCLFVKTRFLVAGECFPAQLQNDSAHVPPLAPHKHAGTNFILKF